MVGLHILGTAVTLPDPATLSGDFTSAVYPFVEPALLIVFGLAGIAWFVGALKARRGRSGV